MNAVQRTEAAWGHDMPHWVAALAKACDAHSLRKVAGMLKVSPALISLTLRRKSKGEELLQGRVNNRLLVSMIVCPVLGLLDATSCIYEQKQELKTTNTQRIQLFKACHGGCLHFKGE